MCFKTFATSTSVRALATSTSNRFEPISEWLPLPAFAVVTGRLSMRNRTGNLRIQGAIQFAKVRPERPEAPAALGDQLSANGDSFFSSSPNTEEMLYYRVGYFVSTSSGTFGTADVSVSVTLNTLGRVLGSRTIEIQPNFVSGGVQYFTVGDWFPRAGDTLVKAGIVITDNFSTHMQTRLFVRFADDPLVSQGWAPVADNGSWSNPWKSESVGNSERNAGTLSIDLTPATYYAQLAIGVQMAGGSTQPNARLHVACVTAGA